MSALATLHPDATSVQLATALRAVPSIQTSEDATRGIATVKAIKAALREMQDASDARIAATRLECSLIRRVGQLGGAHLMSGTQYRSMANRLAELSDDEFEAMLSKIVSDMSPLSAWREFKPETKWEREQRETWQARESEHNRRLLEDGDYYAEWDTKRQESLTKLDQELKRHAITKAVVEIIDALDMAGESFSTRELTEKIKEEFIGPTQDEYEWSDDPELGALLEKAARSGLRADALDESTPARLTYYDSLAGWVRVPWNIASVKHLVAHAEYAQQQADELQAKADRFASLRDDYLGRLRGDEDTSTKLVALYRRSRKATS